MKISGHRTRAVFDRYNIISEDDIRAAVRKTTAYVASLPAAAKVVPLRADRGQQREHGQNTDKTTKGLGRPAP